MLDVSQDFVDALKHDTLKVEPRVRWWFSWNQLKEATVTLALNSSIDADLFPPESVLNEQHQTTCGSAYGITGEAFTSTDPRYGFRTSPRDSEINPILQLTERTAGVGGTSPTSRITVDYNLEVDANVLEIQLDNLRTANGATHPVNIEVFVKNSSDAWVSAYDGSTTNADGRRILYWTGASWSTTEQDYSDRVVIKGVRLEINDTAAFEWNPKVRYVGAHNVLDVTEDIINFSVTKSESEQLTYMPFSEPIANTASLVLDNTLQEYAFKPVGETQPDYDMNMRIDFDLGADLSYIGGVGTEYIRLGTFYTDGLSYSTDMDINLELTDYSKFFQRKFLDDCFYENRSLKFIIKDLLARTGYDAGKANFAMTVAGLDNESRKIPYVWYKSDVLLWDGLADMVKSELGTMFIQEDNTYLFTDRQFLNSKIDDGVQWTIDADIDLEAASQDFTVDANEVEVAWTKVGKNIDTRGLVQPSYVRADNGELDVTYTTSGPMDISSVLWEPGDTLVLSSATIYQNMSTSQDFVRLERPAGDTFPETGTISIEGEYMDYDGKVIEDDYVELLDVTRGTRGTTPFNHKTGTAQVADVTAEEFSYYVYDSGNAPTTTTDLVEGRFVAHQQCSEDPYGTFTAYRPFGNFTNPGAQDYAYGCRFMFRETDNAETENNMGGMFVHAKTSSWGGDKTVLDTYWIEIVSLTEMINTGFITGSLRVFRTSDKNPISQRSGLPPTTENAIYGHDSLVIDKDIPVNIDCYWDASTRLFSLYVNDVFMTSWQAEYEVPGELEHPDAIASPWNDNYVDGNSTGYFGVYVRGNTKAEFEYVYGGDIDRGHESYVADYIYGGYVTNQWKQRETAENFLEFGSIAHELRHFEVEHQVWPNRWVRIFHSNTLEAAILYENHTSFRSEFDIINTSRSPAVLVGNDQSPYNSGLGANHQLFVYGSTVIELESGEKVARDKNAIRRRGISNVRVESPWVQSEEQGKKIADWVTENWAEPVSFYDVEWFPMWALQPGDRVDINYPEKGF